MSDRIRLSKKHGVNPALLVCFCCGKDSGSIALLGHLKDDAEAPRRLRDREPCDECKGYMQQGVILVSVKDDAKGDDPYRTGGWVVVRDEAIRRMKLNPHELEERILKKRFSFISDEAWDRMGLPRGAQS